jgi:DNA-binding SARP family transcriptional activator
MADAAGRYESSALPRDTSAPWLEFRVLGPLEVETDTGPLPLGGPRQRAVLAMLLLRANEVVSTERIVDELWGEHPPRTASTSLQNAVVQLRKLLGSERLVTRPPGYLLKVEPEQLDLARFEGLVRDARSAEASERAQLLRQALALWRGDPLSDLASEEFAHDEIRRLDELRLSVVEDRIDADLELDRSEGLVGELESLVARNPLRERLRGQLMLALYRAGRQAEALQAYHDARRMLVDELGIEPGPTLQQLHGAILRQERVLQPSGVGPSPADHYADVLKGLLTSRLVPVLGPGVFLSGRPEEAIWDELLATFLPGDAEVAAHLARLFDCPPEVVGLARVSEYVAVTRGVGPLYDELHALFDRDYPPGPAHRLLASLPPLLRARGLPCQLIITSGYDATLEHAFADAGEELDVVAYVAFGRDRGKFLHLAADGSTRVVEQPNIETGITTDERTVLLKIHGGVDRNPQRERESFVVSEDDYIDYLAQSELASVLPVTLAAKLRRSHFLFLGYALEEWSLRVFLRRLWGEERFSYRSWAVQPSPSPVAVEYWRQRGVDVFELSLEEYVDELRKRVDDAIAREIPA